MKIYAQKQPQPQQQASTVISKPSAGCPAASPMVHSILHLQRTIGNQAVCRLLEANSGNVEGDSTTAETAGFGHDLSQIPVGPPPAIQRKSAECEDEENETIQAKRTPSGNAEAALDVGGGVRATGHAGEPLPKEVRDFFEPRFRHDFSRVRVHADSAAVESARGKCARLRSRTGYRFRSQPVRAIDSRRQVVARPRTGACGSV